MAIRFRPTRHQVGTVLLAGALALVGVACDPGFTLPMVGSGTSGSSGDGGAPKDAQLMDPGGLVVDPSGAYFVLDTYACVIRKVENDTISTVAGTGTCGYSGDNGPATAAQIYPFAGAHQADGMALDGAGNLFFADSGNDRIRKIDTAGQISTVTAGLGHSPDSVTGVAVTKAGSLYALIAGSGLVRVAGDGTVTVVLSYAPALAPAAIVADPAGGLFLGGVGIEHLDEGATTPTPVLSVYGQVKDLAADGAGNLYAATDHHVLRIKASGASVIAGTGQPDPATGQQSGDARFLALSPRGLAATLHGGLLVSSGHVVYRIDQPEAITSNGCDDTRFYPGANLSGQNLAGMDLTGCYLRNARFGSADLSGADLSGLDLTDAGFENATLTGATVDGTKLAVAAGSFNDVVSGGLIGTPSVLPPGYRMVAGYLVGPHVDLSGADLVGADLSGLDLGGTSVWGADFSGATLTGVRSGGVLGEPAKLPAGWILKSRFLLGPGADLSGSNASNWDFSGVDFTGMTLTGTNFWLANLSGADLSGATIAPSTPPNFDSTNLSGADLSGLDLSKATVTNATLTGAIVEGTNLAVGSLLGIRSGGLIGTPSALPLGYRLVSQYLVGPNVYLTNADLSGADLSGLDLSNTKLDGVHLSGTTLTGVRSGNVTGVPVSLPVGWFLKSGYLIGPGANLSNAITYGKDFSGIDFTGVVLTGMNFTSSNLHGANLSGATFAPSTPPNFTSTNLSGANLSGLDLSKATVTNATLTGATVGGTDLSFASLSGVVSGALVGTPSALPTGVKLLGGYLVGRGANLVGAQLSGADLSGVDLRGANLAGVDLSAATLTGVRSGDVTGVPAALPPGWIFNTGCLIGPGADLSDANVSGGDFSGLNFTGVTLTGTIFVGANLSGANLSGATIVALPWGWTSFKSANLTGANLSGLDLSRTSVRFSTMTGANITGTNLNTPYLEGVVSGGLIGTPSALAPGWTLVNGTLIAP